MKEINAYLMLTKSFQRFNFAFYVKHCVKMVNILEDESEFKIINSKFKIALIHFVN